MTINLEAVASLQRLFSEIRAVCPTALGTDGITIKFDPATPDIQIQLANDILSNFNPNDAVAQTTYENSVVIAKKQEEQSPVLGSLIEPVVVGEAEGVLVDPQALKQIIYVKSAGGQYVVTAIPQISEGSIVGQELILIGTSDLDAFAFVEGNGVFSGNAALQLISADCVIAFTWLGKSWVNMTNTPVINTVPQ